MDVEPNLRLRALLEERYAIVLVALLLLVAVGTWGVYATHVDPGAETEERVVSAWSSTAEFDHGSTVQNDTGPFAEGEELTNRTVYFIRATPELDGQFSYRYDAGGGGVDAHTELELVVRAVDDEGEIYWQATEPLGDARTEELGPGDRHELPFAVDVNATIARIDAIEEELGASPGTTETLVRARTTVDGTVHGDPVSESYEHDLRIEPDGSTYRVDENPAVERYESVREVTVPVEYGPLRSVGTVLLFVGSLIGLIGLVAARRTDSLLSEAERRRIEHARERGEFDDWISRGRLPPEIRDHPRIEIESLEELVDVAIDSDRRVIEEPGAESYCVVDDGYLYAYTPPADREPPMIEEGGETEPSDGEADA